MKNTSGKRCICLVIRIPLVLFGTLERFYVACTCIFPWTMYFSAMCNGTHNEKHWHSRWRQSPSQQHHNGWQFIIINQRRFYNQRHSKPVKERDEKKRVLSSWSIDCNLPCFSLNFHWANISLSWPSSQAIFFEEILVCRLTKPCASIHAALKECQYVAFPWTMMGCRGGIDFK